MEICVLNNRVRPVLKIFDNLSAKILIIYDGIPAIGHRANNGDMGFKITGSDPY